MVEVAGDDREIELTVLVRARQLARGLKARAGVHESALPHPVDAEHGMSDDLGRGVAGLAAEVQQLERRRLADLQLAAVHPVEPIAPQRPGHQFDAIEAAAQLDGLLEHRPGCDIGIAAGAEHHASEREHQLGLQRAAGDARGQRIGQLQAARQQGHRLADRRAFR